MYHTCVPHPNTHTHKGKEKKKNKFSKVMARLIFLITKLREEGIGIPHFITLIFRKTFNIAIIIS